MTSEKQGLFEGDHCYLELYIVVFEIKMKAV